MGPKRLGRYQIVKHLASGGMAEVLLGCLPDTRQLVVLKRIRSDQAEDMRFVEMFLDEARIASILKHPNIVEVFETCTDGGEFFYAMEFVHGHDLRKILMEVHRREDQLSIALITTLISGVAAGLHHAHTQLGSDHKPLGIVHRDVSPSNILVGNDGSVKVSDFGIAKAALRTVETRSGSLKGKVSYMSPEQVTGQPVDRRSDVFALGVVLYELATARRLFKGDNDWLTMTAIVQGEIPPPTTLRPDLPRVLEEIIMTALAASPRDRFQSADEVRAALSAFTGSLGMKLSPSSIADYVRKLFGPARDPWLVDDDERTETTSIDFDGSTSGVAVATTPTPLPFKLPANAPLAHVYAQTTNTPLEQVASQWSPTPASSGSASGLGGELQAMPIARRGSWRLLGIAFATIAAAVIAIVMVVRRDAVPEARRSTEPAAAVETMPAAAPAPATPAESSAAPVVPAAPPAAAAATPGTAASATATATPSTDERRAEASPAEAQPVADKRRAEASPAKTQPVAAERPRAAPPAAKPPPVVAKISPERSVKRSEQRARKPAKPEPSKAEAKKSGNWDPNNLFAPE